MGIYSPRVAELAIWQQVPNRVVELLPTALEIKRANAAADDDAGLFPVSAASWAPGTATITVHTQDDPTSKQKRIYREKLSKDYSLEFSTAAPNLSQAVVVKKAAWFPNVGKAWDYSNKAFGGPSPLSNAIVSGLLLGGIGYGTGALAEELFPERFLERGVLKKPLALIGALGGVGLGAANAHATHQMLPQNGYWSAWITNNNTPIAPTIPEKAADFKSPTGIGNAYIPVDAFNRATWADASKNYDQSSYVNHTSPQLAAATTGILSGIKQQVGSDIISPHTVIRGLASAGVGLATATLAGKTIGALAGLSPVAQENIQNMGLWGGMLHTVIPPVLNWR